MIKNSIEKLAKRIFILLAITFLASLPVFLLGGTGVDSPSFETGIASATEDTVILVTMISFTIIAMAVFFFSILPALLELGQAVWDAVQKARSPDNDEMEMFP